MTNEDYVTAYVSRNTVGGAVNHKDCVSVYMEVRFSKTRATVYLPNGIVLTKVKGGHKGGVMSGRRQTRWRVVNAPRIRR